MGGVCYPKKTKNIILNWDWHSCRFHLLLREKVQIKKEKMLSFILPSHSICLCLSFFLFISPFWVQCVGYWIYQHMLNSVKRDVSHYWEGIVTCLGLLDREGGRVGGERGREWGCQGLFLSYMIRHLFSFPINCCSNSIVSATLVNIHGRQFTSPGSTGG